MTEVYCVFEEYWVDGIPLSSLCGICDTMRNADAYRNKLLASYPRSVFTIELWGIIDIPDADID